MTHVTGPFEVKMTPQADEGSPLGRMLLDKQYHGDLEATSIGQMLAGMTAVTGSAGYVAMEKVIGALDGRAGTFILMHMGVMDRGAQSLTISVIPDSGTGELEGLSGTMKIVMPDGKHAYEFDYELPATA
ncbi:DUF3224 domain-containing protein [Longimicrobium terrae]|uniref:DUF3224 domain-containing protein n=1 Tax=Longimicrobium terrae TaxID=1639882 RepID=A0A841GUS2_9BACT|nr:DUF3224 domain-containing protein [Longimicrobium terrae]MBB4634823.1 hypothetical protein [Longimicrobium terrae]MBB6069218.1 hypothetical protein [Longimicrobium terrae]NNC31970.1 DUF3224 domain-containing protein [Longimicrobium terrae]